MQKATHRKIYKVKDWNSSKTHEGKYILVYTLGNGSMVDTPRKRGYVVQKWIKDTKAERSRYHKNYASALADFYQDNF